MVQQIILKYLERPVEIDTIEEIFWFCESFGFHSGRDTERVAVMIILSLLKQLADSKEVAVENLAEDLDIHPSRVNHHLRNLIESGLLYRKKRMIHMRGGSLVSAVREIRKDAQRIFDELEVAADEIDSRYGFRHRP